MIAYDLEGVALPRRYEKAVLTLYREEQISTERALGYYEAPSSRRICLPLGPFMKARCGRLSRERRRCPAICLRLGPAEPFRAGGLVDLRALVGDRPAWVPSTVLQEVADGVEAHPHLRSVLDADWLTSRDIVSTAEMEAFGRYASRLLGDDQRANLGECGALALGDANAGTVVVDDGAARHVAGDFGVEVKTTVALLCDLVRDRLLGFELAATIADDLLRTEYRLPLRARGFPHVCPRK